MFRTQNHEILPSISRMAGPRLHGTTSLVSWNRVLGWKKRSWRCKTLFLGIQYTRLVQDLFTSLNLVFLFCPALHICTKLIGVGLFQQVFENKFRISISQVPKPVPMIVFLLPYLQELAFFLPGYAVIVAVWDSSVKFWADKSHLLGTNETD